MKLPRHGSPVREQIDRLARGNLLWAQIPDELHVALRRFCIGDQSIAMLSDETLLALEGASSGEPFPAADRLAAAQRRYIKDPTPQNRAAFVRLREEWDERKE